MKILKEDYEQLKKEMLECVEKYPGVVYLLQNLSYRNRVLWNMLFACQIQVAGLYSYLNDGHIEVALNKICKEILENEK